MLNKLMIFPFTRRQSPWLRRPPVIGIYTIEPGSTVTRLTQATTSDWEWLFILTARFRTQPSAWCARGGCSIVSTDHGERRTSELI